MSEDKPTAAFKVLTAEQMAQLESDESFAGAPIDLEDGYIHLSTAAQLDETVAKHFTGQQGLWIVEVDLEAAGESVRWERSRADALFPHLYTPLTLELVVAYSPLEHDDSGAVRLPVTG